MKQTATVHTKGGLLAAIELANNPHVDTKITFQRKSGVTEITITGTNMNENTCDKAIRKLKSGIRRIKATDLTA